MTNRTHITSGKFPTQFSWLVCILSIALLSGCANRSQPTNTLATPDPPTLSPSPTLTSPSPTINPTDSPSPVATQKSEATRSLESRLRTVVAEAIQLAVESVDCPAETEAKAGNRFDCQMVVDGQTFTVVVERTDAEGQFRWNTKGLLQLAKLEQFLQQELKEKRALEVKAQCEGEVRVAQPNETFECQVTDVQGNSRPVQVTVKDEQGKVDIQIPEQNNGDKKS